MKYLSSAAFSVGGYSAEYTAGYERTFKKKKPKKEKKACPPDTSTPAPREHSRVSDVAENPELALRKKKTTSSVQS